MTERERTLVREFNGAPIARFFGMTLSFPEPGVARVDLPYNPNLDHALHGVHGGVIATLVDIAGWFASAARREAGWVATAEFRVHTLEHVEQRALHGLGRVLRPGRALDVCEMRILDDTERLVAYGTGTFVPQPKVPFGGAPAADAGGTPTAAGGGG
ncbi:MAG: PaaI family thioesterase [Deltaproteobacteria bacterium]|nr:PaaI family thioesterase [Deltaproteobacteria bacterium]